ncbi:unnamed protein product [Victoria cruziana]
MTADDRCSRLMKGSAKMPMQLSTDQNVMKGQLSQSRCFRRHRRLQSLQLLDSINLWGASKSLAQPLLVVFMPFFPSMLTDGAPNVSEEQ